MVNWSVSQHFILLEQFGYTATAVGVDVTAAIRDTADLTAGPCGDLVADACRPACWSEMR
jgi:hypothetical protein